MKSIVPGTPYGELQLTILPGEAAKVHADGLFAIIDLKLREWVPDVDSDALLVIRKSGKRTPECTVRLGQLGKRPVFPLLLFFEGPKLLFETEGATHPILLQIHHEAILP